MSKHEAEKQGFTVDTTVYPWIAYKGDRFAPEIWFTIDTPTTQPPTSDTDDIDWVEQNRPIILCLCSFDAEHNRKGYYWEINDEVQAATWREAVRLYRALLHSRKAHCIHSDGFRLDHAKGDGIRRCEDCGAPEPSTPKPHMDLRPDLAKCKRLP